MKAFIKSIVVVLLLCIGSASFSQTTHQTVVHHKKHHKHHKHHKDAVHYAVNHKKKVADEAGKH